MCVNSDSVSNEIDESELQFEKHSEQRIWTWWGIVSCPDAHEKNWMLPDRRKSDPNTADGQSKKLCDPRCVYWMISKSEQQHWKVMRYGIKLWIYWIILEGDTSLGSRPCGVTPADLSSEFRPGARNQSGRFVGCIQPIGDSMCPVPPPCCPSHPYLLIPRSSPVPVASPVAVWLHWYPSAAAANQSTFSNTPERVLGRKCWSIEMGRLSFRILSLITRAVKRRSGHASRVAQAQCNGADKDLPRQLRNKTEFPDSLHYSSLIRFT
jgi:hypothetical protein